MQKYTKIQASVQHGLYLFTCEIHSFNSRCRNIKICKSSTILVEGGGGGGGNSDKTCIYIYIYINK